MRQVYFGWWIVCIAVAAYMLAVGSTFAAFGLYVLPVSAEFNLSRAEINTALILLNLGNAVLAPIIGRSLDRVPVKRVMLAAAVLMGLSFLILSLSRSVWLSAAVLAVALPAAYLGASSLTMTVLIARWFTARRGRAMALAGVGLSLGNVTVTPLVGMLIESRGWREALLISGGGVALLLFVLALLVRERPDASEAGVEAVPGLQAAAPTAHATRPAPLATFLRSPRFWSLSLGAALAFAVSQAVAISFVPLGLEGGLSMIQATTLISVMGGAAIIGALLLAVVADRVDRVVLLSLLFLSGAAINAALLLDHSYPLLAICAGLLGLTLGGAAPAFYALLADKFGAASFGTVRGLSLPVIAVVGMLAVRGAGEVFDRTGGYDLMFAAFIVAQVVAAALIYVTRFGGAPAPAAHATAATAT